MRRLKKYLFILLLFVIPNLYAQLNEFMIMWYFLEHNEPSSNEPWCFNAGDYSKYGNFLSTMKNRYNFNTVYFESHEKYIGRQSLQVVDIADTSGLKSILLKDNLFAWRADMYEKTRFNRDSALNTLNFYKVAESYNNKLLGYNLVDEPLVADTLSNYKIDQNGNILLNNGKKIPMQPCTIDLIPDYANVIREHNPSLLRWTNLTCWFSQFPSDDYYRNNYLQEYINTSKPNVLSFDQYFMEWPFFYRALYNFALKGQENSIPFFFITTPYGGNTVEEFNAKYNNGKGVPLPDNTPAKDIASFNYSIFASLVYGAKGIGYWPGFEWVADDDLEHSYKLMYEEGVLNYLANLHEKFSTHSDILLSLNFASVYHVYEKSIFSNDVERIPDFCKWVKFPSDRFAQTIFYNTSTPITNWHSSDVPNELVVSFMTNSSGKIYYWVFNKSLTQTLKLDMKAFIQPYDVLNNQLVTDYDVIPDENGGLLYTIVLQPGEAKLFTPNNNTTTMPDLTISNQLSPFTFTSGFYAFELANNIQISNTIFNDATKSFMGRHIRLSTGTKINNGSRVRLKAYTNSNTINANGSSLAPKHKQADIPEEQTTLAAPLIYPNPTRNSFIVKTTLKADEEIEIRVYDNMGRTINVTKAVSEETTIFLGNQPAGIYFVHLGQHDKIYGYKVVKL